MRRINELEERVSKLEYGNILTPPHKMEYYYSPLLSDTQKKQLIDELHQLAIETMKNREPQSLAVLPDILAYLLEKKG